MAKKNKRTVHNAGILFSDETETKGMQDNSSGSEIREVTQKNFWSGLGRGERIGAIAVCLLMVMGALGAGVGNKIISVFSTKNSKQNVTQPAQNNSYLSALSPLAPDPTPTPLPLSKEYIYAGSRMLAVEDANASAAPPADLAVWRPSTGYWYVLGGTGSAQTSFQWGASSDKTVPGDYDGDGKTDFSVFRPSTGYWYIQTSSSSSTTYSYNFGASTDDVAPADYDGDGRTDAAVFRSGASAYWYIQRSSDSGLTSQQLGTTGDIPAAADYDGDGKADITVWRPSSKTFYALRSSDGLLQLQAFTPSGDPVSADYDGDGKADFAIKTSNVWTIQQSSTNTAVSITWQTGNDQPVHNDYDGDGKVDIAVWSSTYGYWYIRQSSHLNQNNGLRQEQWGGIINGVPDIPVPAFYKR